MNLTKFCPTCKVRKPIAEFNKNKTKSDGLGSQCRTCAHASFLASKARKRINEAALYRLLLNQKEPPHDA